MLGSEGLTAEKPAQLSTARGMAFWAGTGPDGKTCYECKFRGYRRVPGGGMWAQLSESFYYYYGCAKFFMLTGKHGPVIRYGSFDRYPAACKYFVDRSKRKATIKLVG